MGSFLMVWEVNYYGDNSIAARHRLALSQLKAAYSGIERFADVYQTLRETGFREV